MDRAEEGINTMSDDEVDHNCLDYFEMNRNKMEKSKSNDSITDNYDLPIMDGHSSVTDLKQLENDKLAVYKHPLFPLLVLLLEKCEHATKTLSWNDENSLKNTINSEVKEFLFYQQSIGKSLLSENIEVDILMIKSIQVLRIHLLELSKVQDLCKDFCQRYINCLRIMMNSENLLKSNRESVEFKVSCSSASSSSPSSPSSSSSSSTSSSSSDDEDKPSHSFSLARNHSQDLSKLNAQSIKPRPSHHQDTSSKLNSSIKGTKSLSTSNGPRLDSGNEGDLSDDAMTSNQRKSQKRGILPKHATSVMRSWLFQHITHPYPTEDEKKAIATQTSLTLLQVNNWFINARRRILQPMLDSAANNSNLIQNGSNNLAKKMKTFNKQLSLQKY